jgi:hypothetical protein
VFEIEEKVKDKRNESISKSLRVQSKAVTVRPEASYSRRGLDFGFLASPLPDGES